MSAPPSVEVGAPARIWRWFVGEPDTKRLYEEMRDFFGKLDRLVDQVDVESALARVKANVADARLSMALAEVRSIGRELTGTEASEAAQFDAGHLTVQGASITKEWAAWCHADDRDDVIRHDRDRFTSREQAEEWGREQIGQYGIVRYTVRYRQHFRFNGAGLYATATGHWVKVEDEGKS